MANPRRHLASLPFGVAVAFVGLLVASSGSGVLAKGDGHDLSVRIAGAAGERRDTVTTEADIAIFTQELADVEELATSLAFPSSGGVKRSIPPLTAFYDVAFTQRLAADRFPWNGMAAPHFSYYPGRGSIPAYVRFQMTRASQPSLDGWQPARPEFAQLLERRLGRLGPFEPAPTPEPKRDWWLVAAVPLLIVAVGVRLTRSRSARRD